MILAVCSDTVSICVFVSDGISFYMNQIDVSVHIEPFIVDQIEIGMAC